MAIQVINVGSLANDGTGDDLREAFIKVNQNFDELDLRSANIEGANVGIGGYTVFKEKVGNQLQFRAIQPDPTAPGTVELRVSDDGNTLFLKSTQASLVFTDNTNTIVSNVAEPIIFEGAPNTASVVTVDNNAKKITIDSQLFRENSPAVSATLNMQDNNIVNAGTINGVDINDIADIATLDFGEFDSNITSILGYLAATTDVDFGTITNPVSVTLDEGLIVT